MIDVRDDDFAGGNIVGAVNHPSSKFMLTVHDLVERTRKEGYKKVVFHCALSQVRCVEVFTLSLYQLGWERVRIPKR